MGRLLSDDFLLHWPAQQCSCISVLWPFEVRGVCMWTVTGLSSRTGRINLSSVHISAMSLPLSEPSETNLLAIRKSTKHHQYSTNNKIYKMLLKGQFVVVGLCWVLLSSKMFGTDVCTLVSGTSKMITVLIACQLSTDCAHRCLADIHCTFIEPRSRKHWLNDLALLQ